MVGVFQLFLAYILIGWVFSIYWGVLIVRKTWDDEKELKNFLGATGPRHRLAMVPGAWEFEEPASW